MSIITLTTDYGLKDHFVGALKGKILSEYPQASIIDISHHIDHSTQWKQVTLLALPIRVSLKGRFT
jgi:S-adenosylmethionine hydrolase